MRQEDPGPPGTLALGCGAGSSKFVALPDIRSGLSSRELILG
jgi:hypothetical protein